MKPSRVRISLSPPFHQVEEDRHRRGHRFENGCRRESVAGAIPASSAIVVFKVLSMTIGRTAIGDRDRDFASGCGSTAECGCAKAEMAVRLRSPAPVSLWERSSSVERLLDKQEEGRAALPVPT